jgi:hypothetical protein
MKRTKPKPPSKPKRKAANGDLTPSRSLKPPYTKERLAGLKPAWEPGQSGNPAGRPPGARSRLNEAFLDTLHEAWQRYGPAAVEWVAQNDRPLFVQICASLVPRNIKAELETKPQVIYHISDHPMTNEEWCAAHCDPENYREVYPDGKLTPGVDPRTGTSY